MRCSGSAFCRGLSPDNTNINMHFGGAVGTQHPTDMNDDKIKKVNK